MQTNKKNSEILLIAGIFVLAFALRLAYLFFLQKNYFFYDYPSDDVAYYQTWADQIRTGGWLGQSVFSGMPLYPYFLAVLKGLTLNHEFLIRLAHLALGSFNCILVYALAKKIFSGKTAVIASVLTAADFTLIYYDWLMMPVTLLICLSLIILIGLSEYTEATGWRKWLILGVFFGLGTLGDGKFLIFLVFLFFYYLWIYKKQIRFFAKTFLPLCIGTCAVLLSVGLRNWAVSGDFIWLSAHSGINFYIGNNPKATGFFENPSFIRPTHEGHALDPQIIAEAELKKRLSPREVSDFWKEKAVSFMTHTPLQYAQLLGKKFRHFWTDIENAYDLDLLFQRTWKHTLSINPFWMIVPLALLGALLGFRTSRKTVFLDFMILSQLIFTLLFFLINRHRATVLPFFIIFEAFFIVWAFEQIKAKNYQAILPPVVIIIVLLWVLRPVGISAKTLEFLRATKTGFVLADRKEHFKAQENYLRALQLQPFDTNTLYNLGNSYAAQNNFSKAVEFYERGLSVDPLNTDIIYNLAFAFEQSHADSRAKAAYMRVIELQPQSLDARLRLAGILRSENNCAEAIRQYEFIKKAAPQLKSQIDPLIKNCTNQPF